MSYLTYEEIIKNIIIDSNDDSPYYDGSSICQCSSSKSSNNNNNNNIDMTCTTNKCLNYATLTECIKCSNYCQNNKFQKLISVKLEVRNVENKGHGLFCLEDIKNHQFIKEYVGELVSEKELLRRFLQSIYIFYFIFFIFLDSKQMNHHLMFMLWN